MPTSSAIDRMTRERETFTKALHHGEEVAKVKSKALLRRQAQDFVVWLKKQKAG